MELAMVAKGPLSHAQMSSIFMMVISFLRKVNRPQFKWHGVQYSFWNMSGFEWQDDNWFFRSSAQKMTELHDIYKEKFIDL